MRLDPDWKHFKTAGGYDFRAGYNPAGIFRVDVMPKGSKHAVAEFSFDDHDGSKLTPVTVHVATDHRRKGLATAAYDWASEITGIKMEPSSSLSPDAKKFWKARSKVEALLDRIAEEDISKNPLELADDVLTRIKENDYRGSHQAPDKEDGHPLYNVVGAYPEDFYSPQGAVWYGHGGDNHAMDYQSWHVITAARDKPNMKIKIYRAVPHQQTAAERLATLQKYKKEYLARGKVAPEYKGVSNYYDLLSDEINKLTKEPTEIEPININPGDWVTINRKYAELHGRHALNNQYKILTMTVPAKELFTNADSIHEWGWDPGVKP